jgi:MoxR-like ATPase
VQVLAHRLLPTAQAQLNRRTAEQVVLDIVQRTAVPTSGTSDGSYTAGRSAHPPLYGQQPGARRL